jgi:hypothetical protein
MDPHEARQPASPQNHQKENKKKGKREASGLYKYSDQ